MEALEDLPLAQVDQDRPQEVAMSLRENMEGGNMELLSPTPRESSGMWFYLSN